MWNGWMLPVLAYSQEKAPYFRARQVRIVSAANNQAARYTPYINALARGLPKRRDLG